MCFGTERCDRAPRRVGQGEARSALVAVAGRSGAVAGKKAHANGPGHCKHERGPRIGWTGRKKGTRVRRASLGALPGLEVEEPHAPAPAQQRGPAIR